MLAHMAFDAAKTQLLLLLPINFISAEEVCEIGFYNRCNSQNLSRCFSDIKKSILRMQDTLL